MVASDGEMPTPLVFIYIHIFCLNGGAWTVVVYCSTEVTCFLYIQLSVRQEMASNSKVCDPVIGQRIMVVILKNKLSVSGLFALEKKRHLISKHVFRPPLVNDFTGLLKWNRCHIGSFTCSVILCLLVLRWTYHFLGYMLL